MSIAAHKNVHPEAKVEDITKAKGGYNVVYRHADDIVCQLHNQLGTVAEMIADYSEPAQQKITKAADVAPATVLAAIREFWLDRQMVVKICEAITT
ncbi:hypothetical protein [Aeoliella sp.]|uniref:hypothetical protein n=1 Tax=Aeoliella sp. TaxID=2795800 RepID=UPI003CCB82CE